MAMRLLALDIGLKRTGAAFAESDVRVSMALPTLHHHDSEEFLTLVTDLVSKKSIDRMVVGLPLLLSGIEGNQASIVREYVAKITGLGVPISFLDERYTTASPIGVDPDASSACFLLETALARGIDKA